MTRGTIYVGSDADDLFPDDMVLETDLDLIVELADQAAQGAIIKYLAEDWRRSPLRRMLDAAVARMNAAGRAIPSAVVEAQERCEAARVPPA